MNLIENPVFLLQVLQFLHAALNCFQLYKRISRNRPRRRWWIRPLNVEKQKFGDFKNLFLYLQNCDNEEFFKYTRMTVNQFNELFVLTEKRLKKNSNRGSIPPKMRLAMTLKFLAHGGDFQSVAWEFRVGRSTVRVIIRETCQIIWEQLAPLFMKEPTGKDWCRIAREFWMQWNFPNCLGALDGKHVRCRAPQKSGSLYYNYKHFFSVVLMAACDANYNFIWVDAGNYGYKNDSSVFSHSEFGKMVLEDKIKFPAARPLPGTAVLAPYTFVADAAFPLKECILRPYPHTNLSEEERIFNYRLSRARRTIENTFGILTSRWRVYHQVIQGSADTVDKIILATTVLHNYIMQTNPNRYLPTAFTTDETDLAGIAMERNWRKEAMGPFLKDLRKSSSNNPARAQYLQRDTIKEFFCSESGMVPWQWRQINRGYGGVV